MNINKRKECYFEKTGKSIKNKYVLILFKLDSERERNSSPLKRWDSGTLIPLAFNYLLPT
jgi:hypothetical protein